MITSIEAFVKEKDFPPGRDPMGFAERKSMMIKVIEVLKDDSLDTKAHLDAMTALKIISRDKSQIDELMSEDVIDQIVRHAGMMPDNLRFDPADIASALICESQSCMNNLLLQSEKARIMFASDRLAVISGIMALVTGWEELRFPPTMLRTDLKLVFLMTALDTTHRSKNKLLIDHDALSGLTGLLNDILSKGKQEKVPIALSDDYIDLACEALKVLFNSLLVLGEDTEETNLRLVCQAINNLLLVATESVEKREALTTNCINLLTNIPAKYTDPLLSSPDSTLMSSSYQREEYNGQCMSSTHTMMDFLVARCSGSQTGLREALTPVLTVMIKLARHHRSVRKYLRNAILPPLNCNDLDRRPEESNSPRGSLCKLLTSPLDDVAYTAAVFLFILCKESVRRMVKHTGYGNAAGLLARQGLMLGGRGAGAGDYSSSEDDGDSDTEEYVENAHKINPVVGCVQPERPSPFEGMSEEQKEYEALKLVNLIDSLQKDGLIKPALPGPDGKPVEINHVLQLQEAAGSLGKLGAEDREGSDDD